MRNRLLSVGQKDPVYVIFWIYHTDNLNPFVGDPALRDEFPYSSLMCGISVTLIEMAK